MIKSTNKQLAVCPTCGGSGVADNRTCRNCSGIGMGYFFGQNFLYWRGTLDVVNIKNNRLSQKVNRYLNFLLILTMALIFFLFLYWFYAVFGAGNFFQITQERGIVMIFFWLNIYIFIILLHRLDRDRDSAKIPITNMNRHDNAIKIPDNWIDLRRYGGKNKINIKSGFSAKALEILDDAALLAAQLKQVEMTPAHLLFSSLMSADVRFIFFRLNLDMEIFMKKISKYLSSVRSSDNVRKVKISNIMKEVLISAYAEAVTSGRQHVSPINYFLACFDVDELIRDLLADSGIDREKLANCVAWFDFGHRLNAKLAEASQKSYLRPKGDINKAYTAVSTPFLNSVGRDLTLMAKYGQNKPCVARERELEIIIDDFVNGFNSLLLVGQPGVGRKSVINGLAELMYEEEVPDVLKDKRLVEVDVARLIGGQDSVDAQNRLIHVLNEVVRAGNIVVVFNGLEDFVEISPTGGLDMIKIIHDYAPKKDFFCILGAAEDFYHNHLENFGLKEMFEVIRIAEPVKNQAILMIESQVGFLESKYQVFFSYNAVDAVVDLSSKYIHEKYLPQKGIEILEHAAMAATKSRGINTIIDVEDVSAIISELIGIPPSNLTADESTRLLNLKESLHRRVVGQNRAIMAVSAALRRARVELKSGQRPIVSFLFLGPTGVGKTELAKAIAGVYFGSDRFLARFDMSEYQSTADIEKLIGSKNDKGHLTETVRGNPYSLLLLDEFEKAHPDVHNLFLQVLDAGRLTDGQGKTIDFTNCIIIFTSNIGSDFISKSIFDGKPEQDIKSELMASLTQYLKAEFINRFDDILIFDPLSLDNIKDISMLLLREIEEMLKEKGISMRVDQRGALALARSGYSPVYGARQMRRHLQDTIENEIANKIIAGQLSKRDTVVIDEFGGVSVVKGRIL